MEIKDKLLLTPQHFRPTFTEWIIEGVLNPAAIRMLNGKIMLMVRVAESSRRHRKEGSVICPVMASEDESQIYYDEFGEKDIIRRGRHGEIFIKDGSCRLDHISHFKRVILDESGFNVEEIIDKPAFVGIPNDGDYGVEDPRITKIGENYYMTYVGVSMNEGISTYLAVSKDLIQWERLGLIFREQNKDVVLFPEKINGRYVALNRPESFFHDNKSGIWISFSKDLIYWGKDKNLMRPRPGSWDDERIGGGTPLIKTKKGWLKIYHGVKGIDENRTYMGGAILLDLENPEKLIARSPTDKALIEPDKDYEKKGYLRNVIFPTGIVPDNDGESVLIYSGGADSIVSVRKIKLNYIFRHLGV